MWHLTFIVKKWEQIKKKKYNQLKCTGIEKWIQYIVALIIWVEYICRWVLRKAERSINHNTANLYMGRGLGSWYILKTIVLIERRSRCREDLIDFGIICQDNTLPPFFLSLLRCQTLLTFSITWYKGTMYMYIHFKK